MSGILKSVHNRRRASKSNVNCCVFGCNAVYKKNPELTFHTFPRLGQKISQTNCFGENTLTERRKLWEINLKMGKPVSPHMHVCSRHFTDEDFITPNEDCYAKRFLKKTSVPSQNLPEVGRKIQEKKIRSRGERLKRLNNRRKIKSSNNLEHLPVVEKNLNTEKCDVTSLNEINFTEADAVKTLLTLSKPSCVSVHQNLCQEQRSTSTQTYENLVSKSFKNTGVQVEMTFLKSQTFLKQQIL